MMLAIGTLAGTSVTVPSESFLKSVQVMYSGAYLRCTSLLGASPK